MVETHHNHYLFADYYLSHVAPAQAEWQAANPEPVLEELTAIWERFAPRAGHAEHTASQWIRPALRALGYTDQEIQPLWSQASGASQAPATSPMIDVRARDCRLDQPAPENQDVVQLGGNLAPAFQLSAHMRRTGVPWGILTHGRRWRLFHQDSVQKLDVYYEVDLPALIQQGTVPAGRLDQGIRAFNYFYLFFRRDALAGEPNWLDNALAASRIYKQGISRHLKEQAPEALRLLAQGFLDFPANALTPTPDTLEAVHDNSLIVLYWLLFILYAESRGQLPANRNLAYTDSYSLHALTRRIADDIRHNRPAVPSMDELWGYLRRLWRVLQAGNPDLGVPAHDGRLFDPRRYPFLEQHRVGDSHLRQAIDLLTRAEDPLTGRTAFVNYRDLEVRHLGSIYEGLLEYHLEIRDWRAEIDSEASQSPISHLPSPISNPQSPLSNPQHPAVHLAPSNHARKSSGSYYTPDPIVQWLVEQTLGPVLDDIRARHTERQPDGSYPIATAKQNLIEDILGVKVLDPAMGSGHFLVEVVDFIARYLVSLGLGPLPDLGDQSELTYWRRRAVQSCIYGVDVNPLAVELAKLSLWAMTASPGKPISFLEHHLRCGDSLAGVRMADLHLDGEPASGDQPQQRRSRQEAGQLSMLDDAAFMRSMQTATTFMAQIQTLGSDTQRDVRQAGHLYHDRLQAVTQRYRILADIWTARHFGLPMGSALWSRLIPHVLQDDLETSPYADIIQQARDIAGRRRFFHWELEFPEVFFEPSPKTPASSAGFDAIVGNPPYLFGEHIPADFKPFLGQHYHLAVGQFDAYWLFYERSFWLLRERGRHGFIVPDAMLARDEVEILRARLLEDHRIVAVAPVGHAFHDPGVGAVLVVWEKSPPDAQALDIWEHQDDLWSPVRSLPLTALAKAPGHRLWIELDAPSLALIARLMADCRPLRHFAAVSRGEEAGRRHLRPIQQQKAGDTPVLIGGDIAPLDSPTPSHCMASREVVKDHSIYRSGKIVLTKTGRNIVCAVDEIGHVTLQSVYNLNPHPTCRLHLAYLAAVLSSSLLSWYARATVTGYKKVFPQLNQSNVEELPIRPIQFTTPASQRTNLLETGKDLCDGRMSGGDPSHVIRFVDQQLGAQPGRADVIHDLLSWLAEQTTGLNRRRQAVQETADPLDYIDRDIAFIAFGDAFAGESAPMAEDHSFEALLASVHHDIDGLRLRPAGDAWEVQIRLKKRSPLDGWRSWEYTAGGTRIAREWVPACQLAFGDDKARYYQFAFEIMDQFTNAGSLPGGHTRTTWHKLQATRVPAFDPNVDLIPLVERRHELDSLEGRIARAFELIDQIVYQLYGLTDTEIAGIEAAGG